MCCKGTRLFCSRLEISSRFPCFNHLLFLFLPDGCSAFDDAAGTAVERSILGVLGARKEAPGRDHRQHDAAHDNPEHGSDLDLEVGLAQDYVVVCKKKSAPYVRHEKLRAMHKTSLKSTVVTVVVSTCTGREVGKLVHVVTEATTMTRGNNEHQRRRLPQQEFAGSSFCTSSATRRTPKVLAGVLETRLYRESWSTTGQSNDSSSSIVRFTT